MNPATKKLRAETSFQKLWRWFIAPSPQIQEQDKRRQATLLSGLLLTLILLGIVTETLTIALTNEPNYTGYRQSFSAVFILGIVYGLSRTRFIRLASILAVMIAMLAIFVAAWAQPDGFLGSFLDYLILPLWLGGLYLSLPELILLIVIEITGLLIFPLLAPEITFNFIMVGPFSFVFVMSILLIVLTRHRNLLESDRRTELIEKEKHSRHEAARARALLRVAGRLNAQLDLDTLLKTISEEAMRALNTEVSIVALYDPKQNALVPITGTGISPELIADMMLVPKEVYEHMIRELGTIFALPDLQVVANLDYLEQFKKLNYRSMAFTMMKYEHELIGSLAAITVGESRNFTEDELLLLQGLADQAALAIVNTRVYKDARRRLEHLQALRAIDIAIATNHDLRETLNVLLDQITKQLQVDAAVILLLDETKGQLEFGASQGFETSTLRFTSLRVGEGMAGRAAQQRQIVRVRDLRIDSKTLVSASSLAKERFISYFAAPLLAQGKVKGVLEIFHRSLLDPDEEWLGFLEALAGGAAIAIESTTLFEDLQHTNDELSQAYDSTIEGWSHALDLRDRETEGHTQRVTALTLELAREFGLSESDLVQVRRGALLHDIGKMGIPDHILLKEGPLTEAEWVIMRQHPVLAHEMLRSIDYLRSALDIPYCHHEKWDGTGYPRGLKGEEIPWTARIFAITDVWDAVTNDRPYRGAWSPAESLVYIQSESGKHFDPRVVEAFVNLIQQKQRAS